MEKRFMKKNNMLTRLLYTSIILSVVWCIGQIAYTQIIQNADCLTVGNLQCNTLSAVQCLQQNSQGPCLHCNATTALPNKVCVAVEGKTCQQNSQPIIYCGNQYNGVCTAQGCVNIVYSGVCSGVAQCN
jgi:hypothetical protein